MRSAPRFMIQRRILGMKYATSMEFVGDRVCFIHSNFCHLVLPSRWNRNSLWNQNDFRRAAPLAHNALFTRSRARGGAIYACARVDRRDGDHHGFGDGD